MVDPEDTKEPPEDLGACSDLDLALLDDSPSTRINIVREVHLTITLQSIHFSAMPQLTATQRVFKAGASTTQPSAAATSLKPNEPSPPEKASPSNARPGGPPGRVARLRP